MQNNEKPGKTPVKTEKEEKKAHPIQTTALTKCFDASGGSCLRLYCFLYKRVKQTKRKSLGGWHLSLELAGLVKDGLDLLLNELLNAVEEVVLGSWFLSRPLSTVLVVITEDVGKVGSATTVEGEEVDGLLGQIAKLASRSDGNHALLQGSWGELTDSVGGVLGGLKGNKVGQETSNVWGSHGGTGDGVDGVLATDPGGLDVQTWGEDVDALAVVGEVGTTVSEGGGTDGDGVLGSSWGVVASVGVIIAGGNGEVDAIVNGGVDSQVQGGGFATAKGHVGNGALEALLLLGSLEMVGDSPFDALDDVGHGTGSVRLQHLDGVDTGLLGNTVLLSGDSTGAVGTVAVTVSVLVISGDGLAPVGTALEVNVGGVGAGVDNVDVDTLTTFSGVEVLVKVTEVEGFTVGDTGETPWGSLFFGWLIIVDVDLGVLLDVLDIGVRSDEIESALIERTGVTLEATGDIEGVLETGEGINFIDDGV